MCIIFNTKILNHSTKCQLDLKPALTDMLQRLHNDPRSLFVPLMTAELMNEAVEPVTHQWCNGGRLRWGSCCGHKWALLRGRRPAWRASWGHTGWCTPSTCPPLWKRFKRIKITISHCDDHKRNQRYLKKGGVSVSESHEERWKMKTETWEPDN